jgi:hypothetical protein
MTSGSMTGKWQTIQCYNLDSSAKEKVMLITLIKEVSDNTFLRDGSLKMSNI